MSRRWVSSRSPQGSRTRVGSGKRQELKLEDLADDDDLDDDEAEDEGDIVELAERYAQLRRAMKRTKQKLKDQIPEDVPLDEVIPPSSSSSSRASSRSECDSLNEFFVDFTELYANDMSRRPKSPSRQHTQSEGSLMSPSRSTNSNSGRLLPSEAQKVNIAAWKNGYHKHLGHLQVELNKLQSWVVKKGLKVAVIFEGRTTAGTNSAIQTIFETLNPRLCRVVALPPPSDREKSQWYFQRYTVHLPAAGEIVLFNRSWYNRAGVEKVMGYCSDIQYQAFLRDCPAFEKMLVDSGVILRKYWLDIPQDVQSRRLQTRMDNPTLRCKLSKMDFLNYTRWSAFTRARDQMFEATHRPNCGAAWHVVSARNKELCRLNLIRHLLESINYAAVPEELPDVLDAKLCEDEPDICEAVDPISYMVVPSVYHHARYDDEEFDDTASHGTSW